jgi:hypothetical protein
VTAENLRLQAELSALRREMGYLEVTDSQKIHAMALASLEDLTWRWRLHVPDSGHVLHWGFNGIPSEGIEAAHTRVGFHLSPGRQSLTCAIRRDTTGDQDSWDLICQSSLDQATMKVSLPQGCRPWFTERQSVAFAVSGVGIETVVCSSSEPLVLLRQRRIEFSENVNKVKIEPPSKKRDGLLLWIAPRKNR